MNISRAISSLAIIAFLSACASNTAVKPATSSASSGTAITSDWTKNIPALQPEIRACLISQKMTKSIRYAGKISSNEAMVLVDDGNNIQNCRVNTSNYKVIAIEPYNNTLNNIPAFYPIGRQVPQCSPNSKLDRIVDTQNRLMGTACL